MDLTWFHLGSVAVASFLASLVEFVEALTIILAVGVSRNWRSAFLGALAGVLTLALLVLIFGPSIQKIPVRWLQIVIGAVVVLFGLKWLKKATLRSAGLLPMHDEELEYSKQLAVLRMKSSEKEPETKPAMERGNGPKMPCSSLDMIGAVAAYKAVLLEGLEVVFIIVTAGSISGQLWPSIVGASAALLIVVIIGLLVHKPLSKVPENSLKKTVGILLTAFGLFWLGEGLGLKWPYGDGAIIALALIATLISFLVSRTLSSKKAIPSDP